MSASSRKLHQRPPAARLEAIPVATVPAWVIERFEAMERRIAALEGSSRHGRANLVPADDEGDGEPMPLGRWEPVKKAAAEVGYSQTGLRKAIDKAVQNRVRPRWWWYRRGRLWVDVNRCPRPRATRRLV
jgi:hypothetical protein